MTAPAQSDRSGVPPLLYAELCFTRFPAGKQLPQPVEPSSMLRCLPHLFSFLLLTPMSTQADTTAANGQLLRDPLQQPFASDSIWNHPIGQNAVRVPANVKAPKAYGVFAEEEIIILEPTAPLVPVFENHAGWDKGADRHAIDGPIIARLLIPTFHHCPSTMGLIVSGSESPLFTFRFYRRWFNHQHPPSGLEDFSSRSGRA